MTENCISTMLGAFAAKKSDNIMFGGIDLGGASGDGCYAPNGLVSSAQAEIGRENFWCSKTANFDRVPGVTGHNSCATLRHSNSSSSVL